MALFNRNRFCALVSAFMVSAVLAGCGSGGGGGTPAPNRIFTTGTPTAADRTGTAENDVWTIVGDTTATDDTALTIDGVIDGADGDADEIRLLGAAAVTETAYPDVFAVCAPADAMCADAVVASIAFANTPPTGGAVHLQNVEIITIDGGTVNGAIDASAAPAAVRFNLTSGTITGDVTGGAGADSFVIGGTDITINGMIDGGDGMDTLSLATGVTTTSANFSSGVLTLGLTGGESLMLTLASIEDIAITGFMNMNPVLNFAGGSAGCPESFVISNDITGDTAERLLTTVIDGGGGGDLLRLAAGAVVASIAFSNTAPTGGAVHLQNVALITLHGGRVNGNIDASAATARMRFSLTSGTITGDVIGTSMADTFAIRGDLTSDDLNINGIFDGGGGEGDNFRLDGGVVNDIAFSAENPAAGDIHLQDIETITFGVSTVNGSITGSAMAETFIITGDMVMAVDDGDANTTDAPALVIGGVINGADGTDELQLNGGATVASVSFSSDAPRDGAVHLQNIETITLDGGIVTGLIDASGAAENPSPPTEGVSEGVTGVTFDLRSGAVGDDAIAITGSDHNDLFIIAGDIATDTDGDTAGLQAALAINGLVQGGGGTADEVRLDADGVVGFLTFDPLIVPGDVSLQDVEVITIDGGTVNGNISAAAAPAGITFNLISGMINMDMTRDGGINGSTHNDIFNLGSAIRIGGHIDGLGGTDDVLRYMGASGGTDFPGRGGLAADGDITDNGGDVRNIDRQEDAPEIISLGAGGVGAGLRGLTVRGIEVLELSPALNLYGAMSDALMQFGQQTAQGFALADLNLATGRATQLVSKNSPFTKGRIWAHKVTHSGNGKGSIGLGLTGLTARADSDYDYEMSLTQHGFDAPLAATRLGAFNLRAVSHTMTGVIETNVAEANVSGYGAGVALLWNSGAVARQRAKRARAPIISAVSASAHHHHGLSAHITSLAGAYEVEAHTSPLNPRAVVSEVSEGSFSAINAVVSAGVADRREIAYGLSLRTSADITWQTLSLDDFSETGQDGIIINFDKATRFTARVGAGLEGEHWFSDVVFVHETSSGGTLSSGLSQDYRQDDGTAIEMKLGGKIADLATGLTLKAYAGLRASLISSDSIDPSAHLALNWRF